MVILARGRAEVVLKARAVKAGAAAARRRAVEKDMVCVDFFFFLFFVSFRRLLRLRGERGKLKRSERGFVDKRDWGTLRTVA